MLSVCSDHFLVMHFLKVSIKPGSSTDPNQPCTSSSSMEEVDIGEGGSLDLLSFSDVFDYLGI